MQRLECSGYTDTKLDRENKISGPIWNCYNELGGVKFSSSQTIMRAAVTVILNSAKNVNLLQFLKKLIIFALNQFFWFKQKHFSLSKFFLVRVNLSLKTFSLFRQLKRVPRQRKRH